MGSKTINFSLKGQTNLDEVGKRVAGSFDKIGTSAKRAGQGSSSISKLGGALSSMASVAGGIIVANVFGKLAQGVGAFVTQGLKAVDTAQKMEARYIALMTQNNMYQKVIETQRVANALTAEEQVKLDKLTASRQTQTGSIQEQKQRIWALTQAYGEEGLAVETARGKLAEMEANLKGTELAISNLTSKQGTYSESVTRSWKQVNDFATAQELATKETDGLIKAIDRISIVSPFDREAVELVAQYSLQAQLGAKETERFTAAFLDFAAAQGISSANLGFAAEQFLQLKKIGKLTTIDLRQLRRLGIDVSRILGVEMGMSVDEFNSKVGQSPELMDELIESFMNLSEQGAAGASKRMAQTIGGMQSTLKDIFQVAARNLFRPFIEELSPFAADFLSNFADVVTGEKTKKIGQGIAQSIKAGFMILSGDDLGILRLIEGFTNIGLPTDMIVKIATTLDTVLSKFEALKTAFQEGGLAGVITELGTQLQEAWTNSVAPKLQEWGDTFFNWINETVIPAIPEKLTELVGAITTFLTDQAPQIQTTMQGWRDSFWTWADDALNQAGTSLALLLQAVVTWALSSETQTKLTDMGTALGERIAVGIGNFFDNADSMTTLLSKLTLGLLAAVGALAGTLIVVGGQIVAGILSGILKAMGIDLKPATFNELGAILKGIGDNAWTIVTTVGTQLVDGIVAGFQTAKTKISDVGTEVIEGFLAGFEIAKADLIAGVNALGESVMTSVKEFFGIASPSTVFMDIGVNLIQGMIDGIMSMGGSLLSTIGNVLGNLWGDSEKKEGGEGKGGLFNIDFSAMLENLLVTIPEAVTTLTEVFTTFFLLMFEHITTLVSVHFLSITTTLTFFIEELLPLLLETWITTNDTTNESLLTVIAMIHDTILKTQEFEAAVIQLGNTIVTKMKEAGQAFKDVADKLEQELIPALKKTITYFEGVEKAARAAAKAARSVANTVGEAGGPKFASGTPLGGFNVPGPRGAPFPITVHGGEKVHVTPASKNNTPTSKAGTQIVNNYNLTINNTNGAMVDPAQSFLTLKALTSNAA